MLELFNLHRVKQCKHLVVVEGYFGAIRLHGERIPAVALMGSSISEEQVELLHAHARISVSSPSCSMATSRAGRRPMK